MMFFASPNPNGKVGISLGQGDGLTLTWIPGSGGNGQGEIDTIVSDEQSGNSFETSNSTQIQSQAAQTLPLIIVETDPQVLFNTGSSDLLAPATDTSDQMPSQNDSAVLSRVSDELNSKAKTAAADEGDATTASRVSAASHATTDVDPSDRRIDSTNGGRKNDKRGRGAGSDDEGSAGNGQNHVQFFGLVARAKRVVYVIDASESMRHHRAMEIAKDELLRSLKGLEPLAQFQVVFFDLKAHTMNQPNPREKLLRANPSNLHLAELFIKGIQPDAGTDRFSALSLALSYDPDTIFLLTDADEPEMSAKELWDLKRANKRKAGIHVLEFGIGGDLSRDSFLKRLAGQNNGRHQYRDLTKDD